MAEDVFRKGSPTAPPGYFRWEAAGLAWLAQPRGGPRSPRCVEVGQDHLDLRRLTFVNPDPAMAEAFGAAWPGPTTQAPRRSGARRRGGTGTASSGRRPAAPAAACGPRRRWGEIYAEQRLRHAGARGR